MIKKKQKELTPEQTEEIRTKDFFDMILPGIVKFLSDHYILGDSYRCVWAIREYPPSTEEQAILSQLADRSGVTLRIYHRLVESMEQRKIIQNATRRNKLKSGGTDVNETIEAEGNLQDVVELLANLRKNREPLLHCSVFIELKARNMDALKELQSEIAMELTRSKISIDRLTLRQKEGFLSVLPVGANQFGAQYERVLPASSVANLYPFNFSGKTDPHGIYIGRDKFGTNILVDFDRRAEDKTTSNILILGNSGQGKSYLLKLILTNIRESGKSIICLDPESEYEEICSALGGCYIDFLSGEYTINPLEPKAWSDGVEEIDTNIPEAFRKVTRLSQHIAFLKDFFRAYKDFSDSQIDTIEILLSKLYARFGITDSTDYSVKKPSDFPIMEDFYNLCEEEFYSYDKSRKYLYTEETLQEVCLGIHSMCVGAESKYFNGHTNITDNEFLVFGVKGLLDTNKRLKDAMLFNTALSRLNSFLDSELEQLLCFDTEIDAEKFCNETSAIFVIMPEENPNTFFMISLIIQQLYREILAVADENGGKLKNRCVFFCDEFGTLPKIESAEMMFSASRSRRLQIVPIIQSFSQLDKNYGKEGAEIIVDNTQITLFGGFAPNSSSAEILSKALGSRTVMSGSVSRSKNDPSQSLQMIERPLMTPDELKSMPKGQFVVMKTGFHPMKVKLKLFFKWGIEFNEDEPYTVIDNSGRKVEYAEKQEIIDGIVQKYHSDWLVQEDSSENADSIDSQNQAEGKEHEPQQTPPKKPTGKKNGGKVSGMRPVPPNRRTSPISKQEVKSGEPT